MKKSSTPSSKSSLSSGKAECVMEGTLNWQNKKSYTKATCKMGTCIACLEIKLTDLTED